MTKLDLRMAPARDDNALMRAVLLLALTGFLAKLVLKGELSQYIHPKFAWFTASAGIGLALMALGQLRRWLRGSGGAVLPFRYRLYATLTAVICTGFMLQPHTFGADLAAKQGLNVTSRSGDRAVAPAASAEPLPATTSPAPAPATSPTAQSAEQPKPQGEPAKPQGEPPKSQVEPPKTQAEQPKAAPPEPPQGAQPAVADDGRELLQVTPQNFVQTMNELYDHPERYAGKRLSMVGFVFHPPDVSGPDFAVVRLVVTCHVAHAYPDGLVSYIPNQAERPNQDLWYRVEGVLEPWTYQGKATLKLRIEKATPAEKPEDPYVYP